MLLGLARCIRSLCKPGPRLASGEEDETSRRDHGCFWPPPGRGLRQWTKKAIVAGSCLYSSTKPQTRSEVSSRGGLSFKAHRYPGWGWCGDKARLHSSSPNFTSFQAERRLDRAVQRPARAAARRAHWVPQRLTRSKQRLRLVVGRTKLVWRATYRAPRR